MTRFIKILIFCLFIPFSFSGCKTSQMRKIDKINKIPEQNQQSEMLALQEKDLTLEEEEKVTDKYYKDAMKRHRDQQSDYTRKSMKNNRKRSKKINKSRKHSFFDRLLRPNCK